MAWRDPYVVFDETTGKWLMYTCAKSISGESGKHGCIGCATSENLTDWTVREPVITSEHFAEMECPVVFKHHDVWYMFVSIGDDRTIHTFKAKLASGPFIHLGTLVPMHNYAPRCCEAPDGNLVVLHTVPQRWQAKDDGEYMRGKLAQPKKLLFDSQGVPRLGWYQPLEKYYKPGHDTDKVDNALLTMRIPENFSSFKIRIRTQNSEENGVELIYDKYRFLLRYIEDKKELTEKLYGHKPDINEIKILIHDEYYEIYLDGILEMTALGYRYLNGYCSMDMDGCRRGFELLKYTG
jgi:hypothetical protein